MSRLTETVNCLLSALERMDLRYAIGGSLASSAHGVPRATFDIGAVVAIRLEDVAGFVGLVRPDFYVDEEDARAAIRSGRSFNLIHQSTVFKVDIFPVSNDEFRENELQRRVSGVFRVEGDAVECAMTSVEDTILAKLQWRKRTASEQQAKDIAGMVAMNKDKLDIAYMESWAKKLGIERELALALSGI